MDTDTLFGMSDRERKSWYQGKISNYDNQLTESSIKNKIPKKLIAAIILNELADIQLADQIQEQLDLTDGSFGPAQMQVFDTALKYGHVDIIQSQLSSTPKTIITPRRVVSIPENSRIAIHISHRLRIMQVAIEAVARETNRLLNLMRANILKPWQKEHSLNPPPVPKKTTSKSIQSMYYEKGQIGGADKTTRFMYLCETVSAAYNSPDIIITSKEFKSPIKEAMNPAPEPESESPLQQWIRHYKKPYKNARAHGGNGGMIGSDIANFELFK
ncbi:MULTISPECIES: hypothetical protein [unclassified Corallococcus]|uniref:hypothetical protein n=1 Tax=unclassified Corallococcus TaxID=2685029 RepID=UPI001A8F52FF|nr:MULTISPECIES: hypothetical protein [unclassified Corallococcus]MBN9686070.1 hypothetical protein [Corallococcus sp. NCSPR001]WAS82494.1 hypothetical protein O0N60_24560 [Corallococcus sp. NCRR]